MEHFGNLPNGAPVHRITIQGGGLTAHLLTYGAVLQDLRLEGHGSPLVLGFEKFAPYVTDSPYFGAIVGRCANRVRDGHLELDGKAYQLDRNFLGKHMLHGGALNMGKRLWQVQSAETDRAALAISLADGEMGFPGNLEVRVEFSLLPGGIFDIVMTATTDATTLCNLAHHSYFNLDGGATISEHILRVAAKKYLPVNTELIPTGAQSDVTDTCFDFRDFRRVGQAHSVDHNFCLTKGRSADPHPVAWLRSELSGVEMQCRTTEAGLQVYDGAKIDIDKPGLGNQTMKALSGLALEPQIWPDANHHDDFGQAVLRPGETYRQHTQFIFSVDQKR